MNNLTFSYDNSNVCYTSEDGDDYTYADILSISQGNKELAAIILGLCEWQHPETIFEDLLMEGEIDEDGNIIPQDI